VNPIEALFGRPSAPDPVVPVRRNTDDAIRAAMQNTQPQRGRNYLTIDPTSGLSIYDEQVGGTSGLSIPPSR